MRALACERLRRAIATAGRRQIAGADARGSVDIEANRRLVARFCTGGAALLAAQGELHITHKVA